MGCETALEMIGIVSGSMPQRYGGAQLLLRSAHFSEKLVSKHLYITETLHGFLK
jgi:hypothetical protein